MFDLDSEGMSEMRAAISSLAKLKAAKPISAADEALVNDTLDFMGYSPLQRHLYKIYIIFAAL